MDPQKLAQVASLSRHRKLCCDIFLFVLQLFVVACNVMSRHSSMPFSRIMSRHSLEMSGQSFIEFVL